jgi:hypothetical protein
LGRWEKHKMTIYAGGCHCGDLAIEYKTTLQPGSLRHRHTGRHALPALSCQYGSGHTVTVSHALRLDLRNFLYRSVAHHFDDGLIAVQRPLVIGQVGSRELPQHVECVDFRAGYVGATGDVAGGD